MAKKHEKVTIDFKDNLDVKKFVDMMATYTGVSKANYLLGLAIQDMEKDAEPNKTIVQLIKDANAPGE